MNKYMFLAHTPYHILLSHGIASSLPNDAKKVLLLVRDFSSVEEYLKAIRENSPFTSFITLPGNSNAKGIVSRYLIQSRNVRSIKKIIAGIGGLDRAYVFNDSRAEGQALFFLNKKGGGENLYVEDGAGSYLGTHFRGGGFLSGLVVRVLFGRWYRIITVLGTSPYVDRALLFMPDKARDELTKIPCETLVRTNLQSLYSLSNRLISSICPDAPIVDLLLVLPNSDLIEVGNIEKAAKAHRDLASSLMCFGRVGYKYHPREAFQDPFGLKSLKGIEEICSQISTESLLASERGSCIKVMIGDASTALLTCKLLRGDDCAAYTTLGFFKFFKVAPGDAASMKELGIGTPSSESELRTVISAYLIRKD